MKKNFIILALIYVVLFALSSCSSNVKEIANKEENVEASKVALSNEIFSVQVPSKFDGLYDTEVNDHTIEFYDLECKSEGNPGWVFGIQVFENPDDWSGGPTEKYGELKLNNGKLYDVILCYPTESQFGFSTDGFEKKMPEKYKNFNDARYEIASTVSGKNGEKVVVGAGTKGENLYKDELNKHLTAINEGWDASKLEDENMSTMYAMMSSDGSNVLDKVGYVYQDVNFDGIDELLIGEIADGDWKGVIYDIYTMVNRKPKHVVSGWDRNRYYDYENSFIVNEYSGGANESGMIAYVISPNTTDLVFQLACKYDEYTDEKNPWFKSYSKQGDDIEWESTTEEEYNNTIDRFSKYEDLKYIPFSSLKT